MINPHRFVKKERDGEFILNVTARLYMAHVDTVGLEPLVSLKK